MPVFGTSFHLITLMIILLDVMLLNWQFVNYLLRPWDGVRLWHIGLLCVMLFYDLAMGLPYPQLPVSISWQIIMADVTVFMAVAYFPVYFYKAFDLDGIRWHAFLGAPALVLAPCLRCFVAVLACHGSWTRYIKYGLATSSFYTLFLIFVIGRAVWHKRSQKHGAGRVEIFVMLLAVTSLASLTVFEIMEASQVVKVLCSNTGAIFISLIFIGRSVRRSRREYELLTAYSKAGINAEVLEINSSYYGLTSRQVEIVLLIRKGMTYREIAEALFISEKTVSNHIQNIYEKTGAANKLQLLHKLAARQ